MVISFSPRHLSYLVFKRRKLFLGTLATALALYSGLVLTQKSQYESTSSIVVKIIDQDIATPTRLSEQNGAAASSFSQLAKEVINSVQVVITSPDVLDKTLSKMGIDAVYPRLTAKAQKARLPITTLASEKLLQDISVRVNNETNVLTLSLFNTSPTVARATLQALVSATVAKHAMVMRDPRLQFLERKLATLKNEYDSAEQAVLQFKQASGISSFDEERSLLLKQRDTTQGSRNEIQAQSFASQSRAKALEGFLAATPKAIAITDENDRMQRQMDVARERLTTAQTRYEAAKQRFTEGNPELIDQSAQLDSAKRDFEQISGQSNSRVRTGANPVNQALSQSFSTARSDATATKAAIEERDAQLAKIDQRLNYLNQNEMKAREYERRRDLAERDYRSYLERAQSARIVSDMNDAGLTSLSVLQAPTLPYQPARPRKLLLLLLALFAGLAGGLALCLFLESMDDTLALPEQVETALGLPLLAVVNHHRPELHR
ncbi:MAG TPA: hypothetical protein VFG30_10300 [Polyangiales bacterium]|nr:hypothetical protein [Polyangiales bacterium]